MANAKKLQLLGPFPSGGAVDPSVVEPIVEGYLKKNPINPSCYFTSLALAKAAAATAEEVGRSDTVYFYGQKLMVDDGTTVKWYTIQRDRTLLEDGSGNSSFTTDSTLTLKDGVLKVNTTNEMTADNTLPITSAGVYAQVGNINALLETI